MPEYQNCILGVLFLALLSWLLACVEVCAYTFGHQKKQEKMKHLLKWI